MVLLFERGFYDNVLRARLIHTRTRVHDAINEALANTNDLLACVFQMDGKSFRRLL